MRLLAVVALAALALLGLTGCVGSRLDRHVEWLQGLEGVEFAEVVAEYADSGVTTGPVRGELSDDVDLKSVQELARLALAYGSEHGGTFQLGRDLVDFEIRGQGMTPANVEKWNEIVGTPGVLSGLVGFTGTDVRVLRDDAREVLERVRDFPGSFRIETFRTRAESETDRWADGLPVPKPGPGSPGPVFVIDVDCDPTDAEWQRALLIADDVEIVTGTFLVCDD